MTRYLLIFCVVLGFYLTIIGLLGLLNLSWKARAAQREQEQRLVEAVVRLSAQHAEALTRALRLEQLLMRDVRHCEPPQGL